MLTPPARRLARSGASAALLVLLMSLASVGLWVGVPIAWLWIGGRVEGATQSLGAAVAVAFSGLLISLLLIVPLLGWLNRKYTELRSERGEPPGASIALEVVLVLSAGVAVVLFCLWFFVFAGADPLPFIGRG